MSGLVAGRYDLLVESEHADRARALLAELRSDPPSPGADTGAAAV